MFGYPRPTSPFLDQLASQGVLFENMVSAAPATFPSVNSLFTSRQPNIFYQTSAKNFGIPEEMVTLAEIFRNQGLRTAAVSSSPVVRNSPSGFNPTGGFGRGFETFDESCGLKQRSVPAFSAPCITEQAIAALETFGENPFFLYVHYLDPHDPYAPPPTSNQFAGSYQGKKFIAEGQTYPIRQLLDGKRDDFEIEEEDILHLIALYDGEILAVDGYIEKLFAEFRKKGLMEDTLFVFVSDHGESFLEHEGVWQHARSVYQTELRTLLLFYWQGQWSEGMRRSDVVCTIDVMPSILDLVGLEIPEEVQGRPLFSDSQGNRRDGLCLSAGRANWRAQQSNLLALRLGHEKLIYDRKNDHYEMYNLALDPDEQMNLAEEGKGERLQALKAILAELDKGTRNSEGEAVQLDPEAEKALRALGYID